MKTLKVILLACIVALSFNSVKASKLNTNDDKLSVNYAVNVYVDALCHGKLQALPSILADELKWTMKRGDESLVYGKAQFLENLKSTENVNQECTVTTSISETDPATDVVKIEMHYNGFTRINYVTLTDTGRGWKVTNVFSSFK